MRRLVTRSALGAAAVLLTVFTASAAEAATEGNSSRGGASVKWESRDTIVGPTSPKLGSSEISVTVSANLDPMKEVTKPLLAVAMDNMQLEASWADAKSIDLTMLESTKDGSFKVEHTLAPHMTIYIDAFGFKLTYDYPAASLINYIPGSNWTYHALGSTEFDPWGFKGGVVNINPPPLNTAQLFSIPIPAIAGSQPLTGTMSLNATTDPDFEYATTEVVIGDSEPLTGKAPRWTIPTTDKDFLDIPIKVKGRITYTGVLLVRPAVTITKIGSITLPFPLVIDLPVAGTSLPFSNPPATPIAVVFPIANAHIPLPNVKALKSLDLGTAQIGSPTSKKGDIQNTGEAGAVMTFKSSDPQFTVTAAKVTSKPKDKVELDVTFTPQKEGPQSAEITVASNDPNEPTQIVKVTGIGTRSAEPPKTETPAAPLEAGPQESGCGCRTAPSSSSMFGVGAAFVAVAALLRRRRRA
jgi:MYXO-CTERM domain-containing protein